LVAAGDDAALSRAILDIQNGTVDVARYRACARTYAVSRFDREAVYGPLAREAARRFAAA